MLMTPLMASLGAMLAFFTVVGMVVVLPTTTFEPPQSENWRPLNDQELEGRNVFLDNGCIYCHSGFTRPQDEMASQYYVYSRVSEPGDYTGPGETPNLFGTIRTGPDLSQAGGFHPDDWHEAHYDNPRNTTPISIMPSFSFLDDQQLGALIAFSQSRGGKEALLRYVAQDISKRLMLINMGIYKPEDQFPDLVQELKDKGVYRPDGKPSDESDWGLPWMAVWMMNSFERSYWLTDDPLPLTQENLIRGKQVFQERCVGCHGSTGDGSGPAAAFLAPNAFNFKDKGMTGMNGPFASDGMFYYRILVGGHGTAMENFGTRLSVEDIWRLVLFLRTIQNGSLESKGTVPTVDMWTEWTPPEGMIRYIDAHPIQDSPGVNTASANGDPFASAAHWVAPGMAAGDEIIIGGKLPMSLAILKDLIKNEYNSRLEQAIKDAQARGDDLPPLDQLRSTEGLVFHSP
jgi:cytochrome c oxidase cbb3-type subunit 2/cytochrome c oxidase cbb3-type subunit I/II